MSRLLDLVLGRRRDARIAEEIASHLAALQAEYERQGLSPADAAWAARRAFGGVDQVKALVRDAGGWQWLESLVQDVGFAVRHVVRDRTFSLTLLAVLALGIGVGHLFFSLTYAARLRGLPIPDVDRVLWVSTLDAAASDRGLSYPEFLDLARSQPSYEALAAYVPAPASLGDEGRAPDRIDVAFTTPSAFGVARVRALHGRLLEIDDDRPGAPPTVVLTERLWRSRYDTDRSILGRVVRVDGTPATVVGVVSDRSGFPSAAAAFLPLTAKAGVVGSGRDARTLRVFGRLATDKTAADAEIEAQASASALAAAFPSSNAGVRFRVVPISARLIGSLTGWWPFVFAGAIVIGVAAANAGNLLLAGALARAREVAVRTAIGAGRARLLRQLLTESLVTSTLAAVMGLGVSRGGVALFSSAVPEGTLPYWFDFSFDGTTFGVLWLITLVVVVVSAVGPAWVASRTSVLDVLKDGGRTDTARRSGRFGTTTFLAVQLGLAVVLVVQVGMAALASGERLATDTKLDDSGVLTGMITLPATPYDSEERRRAFYARLADNVKASGSVVSMALATAGPVEGGPDRTLVVEGRDAGPTGPVVHVLEVSPGYFGLLGAPPVRGRDFVEADGGAGDPVVLVNERLVQLHFPDTDPVGRRIALRADLGAPPSWRTIVGVVPDIRLRPGQPAAMPIAYAPFSARSSATAVLFVRGRGDLAGVTAEVREVLHRLDSNVPWYRVRSLPNAVRDASWNGRVSARLATTVCLAAFALAVFGLFAVVSHRTTLRRREIGLRMAMGAGGWHVTRFVLGSVAGALIAGLALGMTGVLLWNRAFPPTPDTGYGGGIDSLLAVVAALTLTVALGCTGPAWRAVRTAPAEALRRE